MNGYNSILHLVTHKNLEVLKVDVRSINEHQLAHYDVVFHLAALVGMPACATNQFGAQSVNVDATKRLVKLLHKDQRLIYASTTSFYGDSGKECNEDTPVDPLSIYAKTKYEAEKCIMERENSVSLRFATVFGVSPRMRTDLLVNDFTYRACKEKVVVVYSGNSKRTFLHIEDAIYGYLFAMQNYEMMKSRIFNVGDESMNLSKVEVAHAVRRHIEYEFINATMKDFDVRNFEISFSRIKDLGFTVRRNIDDGIREMVRLFKYYDSYAPFGVF
jgi:nucleoside-diphosphate-sugar epimerase